MPRLFQTNNNAKSTQHAASSSSSDMEFTSYTFLRINGQFKANKTSSITDSDLSEGQKAGGFYLHESTEALIVKKLSFDDTINITVKFTTLNNFSKIAKKANKNLIFELSVNDEITSDLDNYQLLRNWYIKHHGSKENFFKALTPGLDTETIFPIDLNEDEMNDSTNSSQKLILTPDMLENQEIKEQTKAARLC